jgi:hypothetical protein
VIVKAEDAEPRPTRQSCFDFDEDLDEADGEPNAFGEGEEEEEEETAEQEDEDSVGALRKDGATPAQLLAQVLVCDACHESSKDRGTRMSHVLMLFMDHAPQSQIHVDSGKHECNFISNLAS